MTEEHHGLQEERRPSAPRNVSAVERERNGWQRVVRRERVRSDDSCHQGHTRDHEGQRHLESSRKKARRPSHSLDADALAPRRSPMSWVAPVLRVGHARLPGSLVPLDPMGLSAATPVDLARRRSPAPRSQLIAIAERLEREVVRPDDDPTGRWIRQLAGYSGVGGRARGGRPRL